ncbi:MAG: hypothetical protein HYR55_18975 [Acidobacteria bacterium]|nr:hypothetical protein [Acidobacteriota bacterium]MBI3657458.1 hypothetical protein [Acidobacteriota bacterium]
MRKSKIFCFVIGLIQCMAIIAYSQNPRSTSPDRLTEDSFVTLTDGEVTVSINSYGQAGRTLDCDGFGDGFKVGTETSVLCQHMDFLFYEGSVKPITEVDCQVINPIFRDAPSHATSAVNCGGCIVGFDQTVSGAEGRWTTQVTISGCAAQCYYTYTDYDVLTTRNNDGSWQLDQGGFLGQYVVRNNSTNPDVHFLFTDASGAAHWFQAEYSLVRDTLAGFVSCADLDDTRPLLQNADWTAAFQYNLGSRLPEGGITISYSHGRNDAVPYP